MPPLLKFTGALATLIIAVNIHAAGEPAAMSKAEFDQMMLDISNWGRWGKDDELGTLNLITAKKRREAAGLVRLGETVSMSLDLNKTPDDLNANPFKHELSRGEFSGHQVAGDRYEVEYHGFAHSHMDGLPHFAHKGFFYNGVPYSAAKSSGSEKLGIHNAGINGVFTRGVIVDMPRFLGLDYLDPGTALTAEDCRQQDECQPLPWPYLPSGAGCAPDIHLAPVAVWAVFCAANGKNTAAADTSPHPGSSAKAPSVVKWGQTHVPSSVSITGRAARTAAGTPCHPGTSCQLSRASGGIAAKDLTMPPNRLCRSQRPSWTIRPPAGRRERAG